MGMVERVAQAIDSFAFEDWQKHFDYEMRVSGNEAEAKSFADWASGKRMAEAKGKARAAIEAMREPTDKMIDVAVDNGIGDRTARCVFTAMIDKTLESGE